MSLCIPQAISNILFFVVWHRFLSRSDSVTVSVWNNKKVHRREGAGFLGCVRLSPATISRLKDTGCKSYPLPLPTYLVLCLSLSPPPPPFSPPSLSLSPLPQVGFFRRKRKPEDDEAEGDFNVDQYDLAPTNGKKEPLEPPGEGEAEEPTKSEITKV